MSRIGIKSHLIIQLVQLRHRTREGVKRYSPWLRHKLYPLTFHALRANKVPLHMLSNKEAIADYVWDNGGLGTWQVRAPCPNKHARGGMSMKTIAQVTLQQHPTNEFKYILVEFQERRLARYKKILGWKDD